jgi:hypothetical protein
MNMLVKKEKEKAPSKKLKEKIHTCVSSFQKLGNAVNEALEQGRQEGFTDKEIGQMIREEMLRAGLTRQTVSNYLPKSAKAKPRGSPSGRFSEPKFSKNFLLNETVVQPDSELPRLETIVDEEDILAKDDNEKQKQKMDAGENTPVSQPGAVIVQRVIPSESAIKLQSSFIELDPAEGEYDIEHLEKYSRNALEQIIKWQHKHLQEDHNKGTPWKSKYMSLKAAYKKATGRDWVD